MECLVAWLNKCTLKQVMDMMIWYKRLVAENSCKTQVNKSYNYEKIWK